VDCGDDDLKMVTFRVKRHPRRDLTPLVVIFFAVTYQHCAVCDVLISWRRCVAVDTNSSASWPIRV